MAIGGGIEAVKKNIVRFLSNTRMLEVNVSEHKGDTLKITS
jgi:hypothetical protein